MQLFDQGLSLLELGLKVLGNVCETSYFVGHDRHGGWGGLRCVLHFVGVGW